MFQRTKIAKMKSGLINRQPRGKETGKINAINLRKKMDTKFREIAAGAAMPSTDTSAGALWDMTSTSTTTDKPTTKVVEECLRSEFFITGLRRRHVNGDPIQYGLQPVPKEEQYTRPLPPAEKIHIYSEKFLAMFYPGTWGPWVGFTGRYWSEKGGRYYTLFFAKADIETDDWYIDSEWVLEPYPEVVMAQRRPTKANDRFLKLVGTDDPAWQAVLNNTTYNH